MRLSGYWQLLILDFIFPRQIAVYGGDGTMKAGDRVKIIDLACELAYGKKGTIVRIKRSPGLDHLGIWVKLDKELTSPISRAVKGTFPFKKEELKLIPPHFQPKHPFVRLMKIMEDDNMLYCGCCKIWVDDWHSHRYSEEHKKKHQEILGKESFNCEDGALKLIDD